MGNWKGRRQNVNVQDMVILKRRCGEAKCLTDPERSLEMTLHSIWPCDLALKPCLLTQMDLETSRVCGGFQCFSLQERC